MGHAQGVSRTARPGIIPRLGHQTGLDRIPFDVARATQEILLYRHDRTLESTLPQVAHEAVATMIVMDGGAQEAGHERPQVLRLLAVQEQVNTVAHEAIVGKANGKTLTIALEQRKKVLAISLVPKDDLAMVAAVHDMKTSARGPLLQGRVAASVAHGA